MSWYRGSSIGNRNYEFGLPGVRMFKIFAMANTVYVDRLSTSPSLKGKRRKRGREGEKCKQTHLIIDSRAFLSVSIQKL